MFFKVVVLKNFAIFTRKHPCWSLFFDKVAGLIEHLRWLLLEKLNQTAGSFFNFVFLGELAQFKRVKPVSVPEIVKKIVLTWCIMFGV